MIGLFLLTFLIGYLVAGYVIDYNASKRIAVDIERLTVERDWLKAGRQ